MSDRTFVDPPLAAELTRGFVDLHVHTGPDVYGRSLVRSCTYGRSNAG